ncbi:RICIN domain-containing protein [Streptomyces pratensis]|uniref:RICIN domain-containing protein n=1 Tax=Streptomyces pratensis TaxID=1169025 RepID=UPI00362E8234
MAGGGERDMTAAQRLGAALRELQQESGRTLRSLEADVMISDSSLSRYLRGSTVPPWGTVRDLCTALGADPADYRVLWEAADRTQSVEPPGPPPVRRFRVGRPWSRLLCATAGLTAGVLLGGVISAFVGWPAKTAGEGGDRPAETVAAGGPPSSDSARIFVGRASGNCLDDSLDHGLRTYKCNVLSYQLWKPVRSADGSLRFRNSATGECLESGGTGTGTSACGDSHAQRWSVTPASGESVQLRNRESGECLEDDPSGLRTRTCEPTKAQEWG